MRREHQQNACLANFTTHQQCRKAWDEITAKSAAAMLKYVNNTIQLQLASLTPLRSILFFSPLLQKDTHKQIIGESFKMNLLYARRWNKNYGLYQKN